MGVFNKVNQGDDDIDNDEDDGEEMIDARVNLFNKGKGESSMVM